MPDNPVIEVYKGVQIRHCNRIWLKVGIAAYKQLIDISEETGLSVLKILHYSGKPCTRCKDVGVVVFTKEGEEKIIKRGILGLPEGSGISFVEQAKRRLCKKQ